MCSPLGETSLPLSPYNWLKNSQSVVASFHGGPLIRMGKEEHLHNQIKNCRERCWQNQQQTLNPQTWGCMTPGQNKTQATSVRSDHFCVLKWVNSLLPQKYLMLSSTSFPGLREEERPWEWGCVNFSKSSYYRAHQKILVNLHGW